MTPSYGIKLFQIQLHLPPFILPLSSPLIPSSHLIPPLYLFRSSFPLSSLLSLSPLILPLQSWPVVLPSHASAVTNCVQVTSSSVAGVVISTSLKHLSLQEKGEVRRQHCHSCQRGRGRRRLETPRRTTLVLQSHFRVTQRAAVCL